MQSPNPTSAPFHSVPPPSSFRLPSIRASQNDHAFRTQPNPKPSSPLIQTLTSFFSPLVETSCIVIAATAFFFMRFHTLVFAASLWLSPPAESVEEVDQEAERALEERFTANLDDTDALHALMECIIRALKIEEAMAVLDRLIEVELEEYEWLLLKANMHIYNDEHAQARNLFEEILKRDPLRVEAFHGLVMATSKSNEPLRALLRRVEEALKACKKQNRDFDV